jgi:L-2,4-diaminobutyric acid acetyltransferase
MVDHSTNVNYRLPSAKDGASVFRLVGQCPPLDVNSMYCNLLQCSHFSSTSVAAEYQGDLVGFISGYCVPERPDTLFVWQVAVSDSVRGKGVATGMLRHILNRPQCRSVHYLETSITEANQASWALFEGFAAKCHSNLERSILFDRDEHFASEHDSEALVRIGPFTTEKL